MTKWVNDDELKKILDLKEEEENEQPEDNENLIQQMIGEDQNQEEEEEIKEEVEIKPLELEQFAFSENISGDLISGFEALGDVPLDIRVLLGSAEKTIEDILEYKVDSIIKLSKMAGELVEIYIGEHAIAKGEIVVIDDKFGILINEILPPRERVKTVENKLKRQKQ